MSKNHVCLTLKCKGKHIKPVPKPNFENEVGIIPAESFFEMQFQSYENLYNQELLTRNNYDDKLVSRISLLAVQFTLLGIQWEFFMHEWHKKINAEELVFCICNVILIFQLIFFYKTFFRIRKNYKEVALDEIRMFHQYCAREKLKIKRQMRYRIITQEEIELITYIKDSYQYCAFYNMATNSKRGSSLMYFDNITITNIIISLISYLLIYMKGDVSWLQ